MQVITREVATKVRDLVDHGLVKGMGSPQPGEMCVEAAVCYALGLPHGDDPQCVSPPLRSLKIRLNDSDWSSNAARANGLRRLAVIQLGSKGALDEKEFVRRVVELAIKKYVPIALRAAASAQKNDTHKAALLDAALRCEKEGDRASALNAKRAAAAAAYAKRAAAAAAAAAAYAADAYAAAYAAYAAYADAAYAAYAAAAAAYADAAYAAYAAAAAAAAKRDETLACFAEDVVQILVDMKVPGVEWLDLVPVAQ